MERKDPYIGNVIEEGNLPSEKAEQPQKPNSEYLTASLLHRSIAQMIDGAVSILVFLACFYILSRSGQDTETVRLYSVVVALAYYFFCDALPKGRSVGKWFFTISVIDYKTGAYCNLIQSLLRNVLCLVLGVIDAVFVLSKKRRRLGDFAARTIVVKSK